MKSIYNEIATEYLRKDFRTLQSQTYWAVSFQINDTSWFLLPELQRASESLHSKRESNWWYTRTDDDEVFLHGVISLSPFASALYRWRRPFLTYHDNNKGLLTWNLTLYFFGIAMPCIVLHCNVIYYLHFHSYIVDVANVIHSFILSFFLSFVFSFFLSSFSFFFPSIVL